MSTTAAFNAMAVAYGVASLAAFPDTVTFKRPTSTVDTVGGMTTSLANTTPASVPCRYRPASERERQIGNKQVAGSLYAIFVPAQYSSALVDLDAKCDVVMAARSGGEPTRTFHTQGVARYEGIEIKVMASLEE